MTEKNLMEAMSLRESGKSDAEIFAVFPGYQPEIMELFETVDLVSKEKDAIVAPREIFKKIISRIKIADGGATVTNEKDTRLTYRGETKGRPSSIIINLLNQFNDSMSNAWKTIIPVGIVGVILVVFGLYQYNGKPAANNVVQIPTEDQSINTRATEVAVGIDSDVNSIVDSLAGEESILGEEESDLALLGSDNQALDAFDNLSEVYGQ